MLHRVAAVSAALDTGRCRLWLQVLLVAAVCSIVVDQGTGLQVSIDKDGAVHILRDRRGGSTSPTTRPPSREFRDCGGNVTALAKPVSIFSPGYPKYESNQFCKWTITAAGDITLRFVAITIEDSPGCEYDNIDVLLGQKQVSMGKVCGTSRDKTIKTNSTVATVIFKSDESYEEEGFHLEVFADVPAVPDAEDAAASCTGTKKANSGNVTSPNYPDQYPDNSSCWTLISVDPGRIIVIRFKIIALEFDDTCAFDHVELFDGPTEGMRDALASLASTHIQIIVKEKR